MKVFISNCWTGNNINCNEVMIYSCLCIQPTDFSTNIARKIVTIHILSPEISFWNEPGRAIWDQTFEYMTTVTIFTEVIVIIPQRY